MPSQDAATPDISTTPAPDSAARPPTSRQKVIWREEFDRIIIENRGKISSALIAEMIGHGCTRSAVIGRAWRLGLDKLSHADPARTIRPRRWNLRPPRVPRLPDVPPVNDALIPFKQRKTLLTLGPRDCRWPVGDPQAADFFFCGAEKFESESYCAAHCRRAVRPRAPRDPSVARNFQQLPVRVFGPGAAPADRWLRDGDAHQNRSMRTNR